MKYVNGLLFEEEPDYDYLRGIVYEVIRNIIFYYILYNIIFRKW